MQYFGTARVGATQNVAYSGTAGTITTAVGVATNRVYVVVTTDAFIAVSKAPTADNTGMYLPALVPIFITVQPGEKVSAIQVAAAGTLYVTEVS